jgi:hypothetical protein
MSDERGPTRRDEAIASVDKNAAVARATIVGLTPEALRAAVGGEPWSVGAFVSQLGAALHGSLAVEAMTRDAPPLAAADCQQNRATIGAAATASNADLRGVRPSGWERSAPTSTRLTTTRRRAWPQRPNCSAGRRRRARALAPDIG